MPALPERQRAAAQFLLLLVVAIGWRLYLAPRFFGWEEGDYGNLMHIREVLDSRFTWFRTSHMPGWYSLAALLTPITPDPRHAGLLLTLPLSALNVAVAGLLVRKLLSPAAGWMVGFWLVLQPEMALYGASTLRSPVFTSLGFLGMALLIWGARDRGFSLVSLSFLTRMEGFFSYFAPALWTWARDRQPGWRSLIVPLGLLAGVSIGWQLYATGLHGEGFFVLGPLEVNLAPRVHGDEPDALAWLHQGLWTDWQLLVWTLPRKISWTWMLLAAGGAFALWFGGSRPGGRAVVVWCAFALAFWLGEGFLSHHDPNHNLYWAWMLHAVPFLAVLGAAGWHWLDRQLLALPVAVRALAFALACGSALPIFSAETLYQAGRATRWYRPQLELSRWMEDELPEGSGVLVSSIPEVWMKRRTPTVTVHSWWLLPEQIRMVDPEVFGSFLMKQNIKYLVWFQEDWTDAPRIAPYLAPGRAVVTGPVELVPVDREDGYGWILYRVDQPGQPPPPTPPPFGSAGPGKGWAP